MGYLTSVRWTSVLTILQSLFQLAASTSTAFIKENKIEVLVGQQLLATCEVTGNISINPIFTIFKPNGEPEITRAGNCTIARGEPRQMYDGEKYHDYRHFYYICNVTKDDDAKRIACAPPDQDNETTYSASVPIEIVSKDCEPLSVISTIPNILSSSENASTAESKENKGQNIDDKDCEHRSMISTFPNMLSSSENASTTTELKESSDLTTNTSHKGSETDDPGTLSEVKQKSGSIHGVNLLALVLSVTAVLIVLLTVGAICYLKQRRKGSDADVESHSMGQANDYC